MGKPKGFAVTAARDPEAHRELARQGGKASHAAGTAHEFTSDEAREAGRKGGRASVGAKARRRAEEAAAMQRIKTVTLPGRIEAIDANEETKS